MNSKFYAPNLEKMSAQISPTDCYNYRQRVREFRDRLQSVSSQQELLIISRKFMTVEREDYGIIGDLEVENFQWDLQELSRLFPENYTNPDRLRVCINILLQQQVELRWYADFPRYLNSGSLETDPQLYDLTRSPSCYLLKFSFTPLREGGMYRLINGIQRRMRVWRNHPAGGTVGMKVTECKLEMIALLNQICDRVEGEVGKSIYLQINSIIRTLEHQKYLASLGYWASPRTTHSTGYAADIEREWYYRNDRQLFDAIEQVLEDYQSRSVLNVINEQQVWHICLNPKWIKYYQNSLDTYQQ